MNRRRYLALLSSGLAATAGCTSAQTTGTDPSTTAPTSTPTSATTTTTKTTTNPTTTITSTTTTTQPESKEIISYDADASSTFRYQRANPQHTGYVPGSRVPDNPEVAWSVDLKDDPYSAPTVTNQYAIVEQFGYQVIDVQNEESVRNHIDSSVAPLPILDNDTVPIAPTYPAELHLRKIRSNDKTQTFELDRPSIAAIQEAPDGDLYMISGTTFSAYSPMNATYTEQWSVGIEKEPNGWITIAGDHVIAPRGNGFIACYTRSDGEKVWEYEVNGYEQRSCYDASSNSVYLAGEEYVEIDAQTGETLSKANITSHPPLLAGDFKLLFGPGGVIATYDGEQLYAKKFDGSAKTPCVADGAIVAPIEDTVQAFDAASGEQLWSFDTENTVAGIALANDHIYVASQDTNFYALTSK